MDPEIYIPRLRRNLHSDPASLTMAHPLPVRGTSHGSRECKKLLHQITRSLMGEGILPMMDSGE